MCRFHRISNSEVQLKRLHLTKDGRMLDCVSPGEQFEFSLFNDNSLGKRTKKQKKVLLQKKIFAYFDFFVCLKRIKCCHAFKVLISK